MYTSFLLICSMNSYHKISTIIAHFSSIEYLKESMKKNLRQEAQIFWIKSFL